MKKLLSIFANNHILANFIIFIIAGFALIFWSKIPKEEMPNIDANFVFITASYPGATPSEVEYFLTKELENAIKGIEGIYDIMSTSNSGSAFLEVTLDYSLKGNAYDEVIQNIKDAVNRVKLPEDIENDPVVREVKATNRSIMSIALYDENQSKLNDASRQKIQDMAEIITETLSSNTYVNSISASGRLDEEVRVSVLPKKLELYELTYSSVQNALTTKNVRRPIGQITNENNARITIKAELDNLKKIENTSIQSSFSGSAIRIKDVANVENFFSKSTSIRKFNGHEAVMINIRKTASSGIIEASDAVRDTVNKLFETSFKNSGISYKIYDDSSQSLRDRLALIRDNGILGFILIFIMLFIFLDFKSGVWVAMGIPFSLIGTVVIAYLIGYSINNMTLSAVIIVLGMIVDDSIIIAENIKRSKENGIDNESAVVDGTYKIIKPVLASILTTCVAFVPLYFFSGTMGKMISVIPAIIFMMLGISMLESIFILPSHMNLHLPKLSIFKKLPKIKEKKNLFIKIENKYGLFMETLIKYRVIVYIAATLLFIIATFLGITMFKFAMSPRETTSSMIISGIYIKDKSQLATNTINQKNNIQPMGRMSSLLKLKPGVIITKNETEIAVRQIEKILDSYMGTTIEYYTTNIGANRRDNSASENNFTIWLTLVQENKRELSTETLEEELNSKLKGLENNFPNINIGGMRFGSSSSGGSPIVIQIEENDDKNREAIVDELIVAMENYENFKNPDKNEVPKEKQYILDYNRTLIDKLSINTSEIANTLRTILLGNTLFYHYRNDVEIPVKIRIDEQYSESLKKILSNNITNKQSYLVPLENIIIVREELADSYIVRSNEKRVANVFADLKDNNITPIETANYFEKNIFPDILAKYPNAIIKFTGEVKTTRESSGEIYYGIAMVLFLIYFILSLIFNNILKPFLILLTIPFSIVGVIFALLAHGMTVISFFTAIGILGLAGVVVNDSIVILDKLGRSINDESYGDTLLKRVANITKTRLRAVVLTTVTTVAGLLPTAYGILGYDSMLSDMMLALSYGLMFGTIISLILIPCLYYSIKLLEIKLRG